IYGRGLGETSPLWAGRCAMTRLSAKDLSEMLGRDVDNVVRKLLPAARIIGHEWVVGSVYGNPGKTLHICRPAPKAGSWIDFNGDPDDRGGLLHLIRRVLGLDFPGAMDWARDHLGLSSTVIDQATLEHRRREREARAAECEAQAAIEDEEKIDK